MTAKFKFLIKPGKGNCYRELSARMACLLRVNAIQSSAQTSVPKTGVSFKTSDQKLHPFPESEGINKQMLFK